MRFEPKLIRADLSHLDEKMPDDALRDERFGTGDEFALPDDLQELAGQLGADADRLATCYPSSTYEAPQHATRRAAWLRWRMAAAAAVLLACGTWLAVGSDAFDPGASGAPALGTNTADDGSVSAGVRSAIAVTAPLVPVSNFPAFQRIAGSNVPSEVALDHIGLPTSLGVLDDGDSFGGGSGAECADFFQDLSAPEQEALLDL